MTTALRKLNGDHGAMTTVMRQKVMALEDAMRKMPQALVPIRHAFAKGLYIRIADIPEGVTLTGKIHRTEHLCLLVRGDVSLADGQKVRRLTGPYIVHSLPGVKRAIHAHTDAVWANLHRTNETDLAKIEAALIAPSFEDLEVTPCHG